MDDPPITEWMRSAEQLDAGGEEALWNHYFSLVVKLAQKRMHALQTSIYDAEDAAASAMHSLFRGMRANRFPALHDRDNLWRLLIVITKRKVLAQARRESARIRFTSQERADYALSNALSEEPTVEFITEVMDETERLLEALPDDQHRRIAVLKLDGLTTKEIADQLGVTSRTIRRKMSDIRDVWEESDL